MYLRRTAQTLLTTPVLGAGYLHLTKDSRDTVWDMDLTLIHGVHSRYRDDNRIRHFYSKTSGRYYPLTEEKAKELKIVVYTELPEHNFVIGERVFFQRGFMHEVLIMTNWFSKCHIYSAGTRDYVESVVQQIGPEYFDQILAREDTIGPTRQKDMNKISNNAILIDDHPRSFMEGQRGIHCKQFWIGAGQDSELLRVFCVLVWEMLKHDLVNI